MIKTEDPAQQDRVWAGYHPRAAVPALASATAASLLVWTGRWYLIDLSELANRLGALAVFALAWGVWPVLAAVYLYRTVTYTYRLTDHAVLVDYGFMSRPVPPVWLTEIVEIRAGASWPGSWLGVGWVEVRTADRAVRVIGVRHPDQFAEQIRTTIQTAGNGGGGPARTTG